MTTAAAPLGSTPVRAPLDPDRILDGAAALIEADGADSFSMRRLAASLGVTPMALYKWFDDRDALLDALGARVFDSFEVPPDIDGPWVDRMLVVAEALRHELLVGRAILPLVGGRRRTDLLLARCADRVLSLLDEIGYPPSEAVAHFRSFHWSIVGFVFTIDAGPPLPGNADDGPRNRELASTVDALGPEEVPHLAAALPLFGPVDLDELFTSTIRSLVLGLAVGAPAESGNENGGDGGRTGRDLSPPGTRPAPPRRRD